MYKKEEDRHMMVGGIFEERERERERESDGEDGGGKSSFLMNEWKWMKVNESINQWRRKKELKVRKKGKMVWCNKMAEGFRFMPLGLVRLRTFRLSTWIS